MSTCESIFPVRARAAIEGHTQQAVADEIGVSRRALITWLSGTNMPVANALYRFCIFTGSSSDYLLGITDEEIIYVTEDE